MGESNYDLLSRAVLSQLQESLDDRMLDLQDDIFARGATSVTAVTCAIKLSNTLNVRVRPQQIMLGRTAAGIINQLAES